MKVSEDILSKFGDKLTECGRQAQKAKKDAIDALVSFMKEIGEDEITFTPYYVVDSLGMQVAVTGVWIDDFDGSLGITSDVYNTLDDFDAEATIDFCRGVYLSMTFYRDN